MLEGRCIVVTGASGNLGGAVCARLLRDGASVLALVHREEERASLASALEAEGGVSLRARVETRAAELSAESSVEGAFAAAEERFGGLWGAVNCAGAWAGGAPVAQTTLETFERMIALNLRSAFLVGRAAMRRLSPRGEGRIVNVAALTAASGTGNAGQAVYAAAKAGVIALTRALAEEGAPLGVRASCVAPGTMRTPQNERAMGAAEAARWVPLPEVAAAIAFLCDPSSAAVNGAVLTLPGR